MTPPCREERRALRRVAGVSVYDSCDVDIVHGWQSPAEAGEPGHYRTHAGERIDHPSAYSKKGWSNMLYYASERRVEVGVHWLAAWRRAGGAL